MDARTRNALLITVLAVVALGIAAATLTSTVQTGSGGGGGGGGGIQGSPNVSDLDMEDPSGGDQLPPIVTQIIAALFVLAAIGCLVYALLYRKRAAALLGLVLGMAVLLWLIVQLLGALSPPNGPGGLFGGPGGFGGGGGGGELRSVRNFALVVIVAGLAVLAAYLFTAPGRSLPLSGNDDADDESAGADEEVTEMGQIAGRVADRIESRDGDEPLSNQVYEAYDEMTEQLDVPTAQSTTPREFAEAAAERGMASEDVDDLTSLFEAVRYGGYPATPDREREAVETLRRIERRYTDE